MATVYRLYRYSNPMDKVVISWVDLLCECCSKGPVVCKKSSSLYWEAKDKTTQDQLKWWMDKFASPMIERLAESHSDCDDVELHITTTLRHDKDYPSNTLGKRFLSVFPHSVLDVYDYSQLVNHCSIFFQKIFTVFSDKDSLKIIHYVASNIGGTRAVDLALLFLFENKPRFFEKSSIDEKWFNGSNPSDKHYEEARAPLYRVYHELMNQGKS
jgi:hypothetical protein